MVGTGSSPFFADGLFYDNILNGQKLQEKSKNLPFKLERVIILTKFRGQKSEKRPRIIVILHIKSKLSL